MILMYHNIGSDREFNTLPVPYFQEHIQYLKTSKYELVSLEEYVQNIQTGSKRGDLITLTFDDAYISICDIVLPLLKKEDIPFSIFVPVDYVGAHNKWDVEEGPGMSEIMTWEQLDHVAMENQVTIGSHGMSHTSFGKLDATAIATELKDSRRILKEKLRTTVVYFAYPFGQLKDLGKGTETTLNKLGYVAGLSTIWGKRNTIDDIYRLKRVEIEHIDDLAAFKKKLENSTIYRQMKQSVKNSLFMMGLWE
ncbi:MAG: polysaccharide deacetylase family protein [Flavobacteriales bacterium]|nr:polysaccharide deacetylase family protein [Flavobacteriales bacterium]